MLLVQHHWHSEYQKNAGLDRVSVPSGAPLASYYRRTRVLKGSFCLIETITDLNEFQSYISAASLQMSLLRTTQRDESEKDAAIYIDFCYL